MDVPRPVPRRTDFARARASPFAYACRACSRCCVGHAIPVNPYEVARLAEGLRLSTTEFLARFTTSGGGLLASGPDGACVFLGPQGCTVHATRPGACRLYPLGRRVSPAGDEAFAEVVPHPESAGVYGGPGTVADWLRAQGAEPYVAMADRYFAVFRRLLSVVREAPPDGEVEAGAEESMTRAPTTADESLLDVDAVVARWCREHGEPVPATVEGRVEIHLRVLAAYGDAYDFTKSSPARRAPPRCAVRLGGIVRVSVHPGRARFPAIPCDRLGISP